MKSFALTAWRGEWKQQLFPVFWLLMTTEIKNPKWDFIKSEKKKSFTRLCARNYHWQSTQLFVQNEWIEKWKSFMELLLYEQLQRFKSLIKEGGKYCSNLYGSWRRGGSFLRRFHAPVMATSSLFNWTLSNQRLACWIAIKSSSVVNKHFLFLIQFSRH